MRSPRVVLISLVWLVVVGLVACGDNGHGKPPPVLRSIAITPTMPTVAAGTSLQLTAMGTYSDATTADLSAMVTWSSSASAIASVNATGLLQGLTVGGTTIIAALGAINGTTNATVTAAILTAIEVTPSNPSLALGTTRQLTAMGVFSDMTKQDLTTQVTWMSDTTHVTVSPSGLVTAVTLGGATITATKGTIYGTTMVTATGATLTSIAITPPAPSLARGRTLQLTATGTFSDATTQDLTAQVTWASGTTATATISPTGLVQAVEVGTSTITAVLGSVTGSTLLTVTAAVLDSIAVTPTNPSVAKGRVQQFVAIGTFSDATTQNLTTQVTWASSDPTIATISNAAGSQGLATTLQVGAATISATLGTISGSTTLTVSAAVLDSIAVTPAAPSVAAGRTQQFTATGTFSDATTQDLTTQVTWASSDPAIATISNAAGSQGLAATLRAGAATISATLGTISGATVLTVTAAVLDSIAVTPTAPSVAAGRTLQFTAIGTFSDATTQDLTTQVTWASSATSIATISNAAGSQGLATALIPGATTISATLAGVTGSTTLTVTAAVLVSIDVTPTNPSVAAGRTQQFTATGTFSDATTQNLTTQVTWASSDPTIAVISNAAGSQGLATTLQPGTATISATLGTISGSSLLSVTAAVLDSIAVTPATPSVAAGRTLQFTAIGTFSDLTTQDLTTQVTWASSDPAIATISNAAGSQGLASAVAAGTSTISATLGAISGSTTLTVTAAVLESIGVTPTAPSVAAGRTLQFTAIGTFSDLTTQDLTTQVTWASSDLAIAAISNAAGSQGLATTLRAGTTTISATLGTISGSTLLTVTAAVLDSIAVTPTNPSVAKGRTQQFTAIGTFSDLTTQDLTTQVTWASSDPAIAAISNAAGSQGLATTLQVGATTISATLGTISGSSLLTVTAAVLDSIAVTPTAPSVAAGRAQQFTAIGTFSDLTTQDLTTQVTWTSSDPSVATISNAAGSQGLASTVTAGATTISATLGSVVGSTTLTVTAAVLDSIQVTPINPLVAAGRTQPFIAIGTFSDATTQDLTTQVTWVSSDPAVAAISNAAGSQGLATALVPGTTTISATLGAVTGATTLTVTAAVLDVIAVAPSAPSLSLGRTQQFTATGTFSDGTTQDLTAQVTWLSADEAIAKISNAPGSQGDATALGVGSTTISAVLGGIAGVTTITATAAVLDTITVTPADASVARGRAQQFTAIGTFSDLTTQDLTRQVTWTSTNTAVAQISNAAGSQGRATTLTEGTTTITATLTGVTSSTSLTVTAVVLDTITVAPATANVIPGGKQQFTATGTFTDGTTQNLTTTVTWGSSNTTIAQVSNAAGTQGQATGVAVGTTTITATSGPVVGSATIVVVGPGVTATSPPDRTSDVRTSTPIVITFNEAINPASLTTQTTAGACSGTIQLSPDNFATCVSFSAAAPVMSVGNTVATSTLAPRLNPVVTYRIRVLGSVTNAGGSPIGTDFTQPSGFTTAGTCAPRMVISQVYGGGGNTGSIFRNDFIELHNVGARAVSLAGSAVQFISAGGTGTWAVQALPPVSVPAGGYFLIQEALGTFLSNFLPNPDFTPAIAFAIGAASGKVALTPTTTALTGASCATILAASGDLVGFGAGLSCFEGTAGTAAPANATSVQRNDGGCNDTNANNLDFTVATPVPRNSGAASNQCSCSGSVTTGEPADSSAE